MGRKGKIDPEPSTPSGMLFNDSSRASNNYVQGGDEVVHFKTPQTKFNVEQIMRGSTTLNYKKKVHIVEDDDVSILTTNLFDVRKKNNLCRTVIGLMAWKLVFCLGLWTGIVILLRYYGVFTIAEFTFEDDVAGWGFIVGLLLVFRTNQGMQRWWEARMAWERVQCASSDIMRQAQCYTKNKALSARCLMLLMSYCITLKNSLRDPGAEDDSDKHELSQFCDEEYQEFLLSQRGDQRALTCLDLISGLFTKASELELADKQILTRTTERSVMMLNEQMGIMIRIKKTPIPYAYAVLLRMCNFLYLMVTPVVLTAKGFGYPSTAGFTMLFGCSLIAIDETGLQMQDPFGRDVSDLPLESYCKTIFSHLAHLHWRWNGKTAGRNIHTLCDLKQNTSEHPMFDKFGED